MVLQPQRGGCSQRPVDRHGRGSILGLVTLAYVDWGKDELDLEEFRDVEDDGKDDDRHDVGQDDPVPRVDALALVVVLNRSPDGAVALQGQGDGDVDGAAQHEVVQGVQTVAESVFVKLRKRISVLIPSQTFIKCCAVYSTTLNLYVKNQNSLPLGPKPTSLHIRLLKSSIPK